MSEARIQTLMGLDKVVNEPSRLALLTLLSGVEQAEWRFLEAMTKLSRGNLSTHLTRLEEAGYIRQDKGYRGKVPQTLVALTEEGRAALARHWEALRAVLPPEG